VAGSKPVDLGLFKKPLISLNTHLKEMTLPNKDWFFGLGEVFVIVIPGEPAGPAMSIDGSSITKKSKF